MSGVCGYEQRAVSYAAEIAQLAAPRLLNGLLCPGMTVAEVPSGTGHFLSRYGAARVEVVLVDASPAMLAAARPAVPGQTLRTVCCRIEDLDPAQTGPVDLVVVANAALNQLAAGPGPAAAVLAAAARLLAPGGLLLAQVLLADGDRVDGCGFYDPALPDGQPILDRRIRQDDGRELGDRGGHVGTSERVQGTDAGGLSKGDLKATVAGAICGGQFSRRPVCWPTAWSVVYCVCSIPFQPHVRRSPTQVIMVSLPGRATATTATASGLMHMTPGAAKSSPVGTNLGCRHRQIGQHLRAALSPFGAAQQRVDPGAQREFSLPNVTRSRGAGNPRHCHLGGGVLVRLTSIHSRIRGWWQPLAEDSNARDAACLLTCGVFRLRSEGSLMPDYEIRHGVYTRDVAGRQVTSRVLITAVDLGGEPWAVWSPIHDPFIVSGYVAASPGDEPGDIAVFISNQYDTVSAPPETHAESCAWLSRGRGTCDCGVDEAWPEDRRTVLKAAALALRAENSRVNRTEQEAARAAEWAAVEAETAWMREPGRIFVGGSAQGWRRWEQAPGGSWRNTGEVVLPSGSLEPYDSRFIAVVNEVIGLYSIRDPRTAADGGA
ncbi:class I SAM-dependent methyltransferase (plasmid) [Streptosporangium sp. NBC_01495]|uniref:methyltransferase n=1 Tax=Streptosporangium sp. NBC_01495 TaxID=2903899 RepID=UPI002E335207|nr:methyltransferase [Streptosporangium sp. NBC_01495]